MIFKFEIILFVISAKLLHFAEDHPLLSPDSPLNVVVNTTNYNERNVEKVITNSVTGFQPLPLPQGVFPKNDEKFGNCVRGQQVLLNENIKIDSLGPSTLSGVFEFYINSPIKITCIEVLDKTPLGTGAKVSLKDGGPGYNWFFLNVQGKYARGINMVVIAYGVPNYTK